MEFANPGYLYLLLLAIPYILWYFMRRKKSEPTIKFADTSAYRYIPTTMRVHLMHLPFFLRIITVSMLVIVLARPQTSHNWQKEKTEGIDIMLAMDISLSMLENDLRPTRLDAAKFVAQEFISNRPNDNIGLTVFAGEAFTVCPLTTNHPVLLSMLAGVNTYVAEIGVIEAGTAIGMGLANSLARLKDSKAKSKVVILITDGANNRGEISPLTAADMAKKMGVRVYTIAAGNTSSAQMTIDLADGSRTTVDVPVSSDNSLESMAAETGGKYFTANSSARLQEVYRDIDKMEKTILDVKTFNRKFEAYAIFAFIALCSLIAEVVLRNTWLKRIP